MAQQPEITYAKHGLRAGDVHQTYKVSSVSPGASGANAVWDFSAVELQGAEQTETLTNGSEGGVAVQGHQGNVTFRFDVTPYGNDYYGYAAAGFSILYEQPVLKTRYPFGFLDQHSGEYAGYMVQGASKTPITGAYSSEVDGYGTLKLPNGVTLRNALRVKTTEQLYGAASGMTEVKYLWYAQEFRYPVFVVFQYTGIQGSAANTSYVNVAALTPPPADAAAQQPVTESKPAPEVTHSVYPNPVKDVASVTYTLPSACKVSVAVYSASSVCVRKLVSGEQQAAGTYTYSYAPEAPGIYFVRFAFGEKTYTEQIVKQ
jgi:hypothetical protein